MVWIPVRGHEVRPRVVAIHENHSVEPEVLRPGQDARLHFRVVFQRKDYTVGDECIPFLPATWNGRFRE